MNDRRAFLHVLSGEVIDWQTRAPHGQREDVSGQVWAYALATFVDGRAVTPNGYDETTRFDVEGSA